MFGYCTHLCPSPGRSSVCSGCVFAGNEREERRISAWLFVKQKCKCGSWKWENWLLPLWWKWGFQLKEWSSWLLAGGGASRVRSCRVAAFKSNSCAPLWVFDGREKEFGVFFSFFFFLSGLSRFRGHAGRLRNPAADWIQLSVCALTGSFSAGNAGCHFCTKTGEVMHGAGGGGALRLGMGDKVENKGRCKELLETWGEAV